MNAGYPLLLDVRGRRVTVVGAGPVGRRRALALAEAGASVQLVAIAVEGDLDHHRITVNLRPYRRSDIEGSWLVHACTGDPLVDARIAADCHDAATWCVRADDASESAAWVPAIARVDDVVVAVNAGADPRRAIALRDAIKLLLDTGDLAARSGRRATAGSVALVGGGPGDPGLITVRGRRLLAQADVIVTDRLGPRELLDFVPAEVEIIEAGKSRDNHTLPQADINALLISLAQQGKRVVRLKGGDPFVFGRGGEELAACIRAGVACEVVPGITSAVAVPAAAGIPVTHRTIARQFTVVTGHEELEWEKLAAVGGTLVILMGATRVERIAKELVNAGLAASTPVAIVEDGTLATQRTTCGTLETIGDQATSTGVRAPAVLVVGDVAALATVAPVATDAATTAVAAARPPGEGES